MHLSQALQIIAYTLVTLFLYWWLVYLLFRDKLLLGKEERFWEKATPLKDSDLVVVKVGLSKPRRVIR